MTGMDWGYACVALMAAVTIGLAVGLATHWAVGAALSVGVFSLLAFTEGFRTIPNAPEEIRFEAEQT